MILFPGGFMRSRLLVTTALTAMMAWGSSVASADDGTTLVSDAGVQIDGVSSVAGLAVGYNNNGIAYWDFAGTVHYLDVGSLIGGGARSVSDTGVIVGEAGGKAVAWLTTSAAPIQLANFGGQNSWAKAVSRNGAFATGAYQSLSLDSLSGIYYDWQALVYDFTTSSRQLLQGYDSTSSDLGGFGVTDDGSIVVGYNKLNGALTRAAYWYCANNDFSYSSAILLDSTNSSVAYGVAADGSVIVGQSGGAAARWIRSAPGVYGATQALGTLGGASSRALGVSGDGSVIVGQAMDGAATNHGFRWASADGMVTIENWLADAGLPWGLGPRQILSANAVSTDGTTVVGNMSDGTGYIARVSGSSPTPTPGLITLDDFATSLSGASTMPSAVSTSSDLVMHGSHGHPLSRVVAPGKATAWMDGDIGGAASHDSDAYNNIGEIGGGYRFSRWVQGNLAVGKMYAGQKTVFEGKTKQNMTYVLPEAIINLADSTFWLTLSGQYAAGDLSARRGYLNAGNLDASNGNMDASVYAARARLDWRDAATIADVRLTPYIDHQHTQTRLGAYTETGGAFPVQWNTRTQADDTSRIGFDARKPLTDWLTLDGTVEEVHWWQGRGEGATGQVIGLSDFALPGEKDAHDWARFGLGLTADVGDGRLSAMANVSTQGDNPKYWMGLGYQIKF